MKILPKILLSLTLLVSISCTSMGENPTAPTPVPTEDTGKEEKVIVAYVTSWSDVVPDPSLFTHLNYAFGHVNDTFDGVRIDNPERFQMLARLKENNPDLKVLLSIGGWGSGRFSEMAASDSLRNSFAQSCREILNQYQIDGIDIDWEYPTIDWAEISASPDDTENYTKLMQDIRSAIGEEKLLTLASSSTAKYIDFKKVAPIVDFVNLMTYDMSNGLQHHAPLYHSSIASDMNTDLSVKLHQQAGVPDNKIVVGMPFYGRGNKNGETFYRDFKDIHPEEGETEKWDSDAQEPYIADMEGNFVMGYDNPQSIAIKCKYILDNDLRGAMYWDYNGDDTNKSLSTTIHNLIRRNR